MTAHGSARGPVPPPASRDATGVPVGGPSGTGRRDRGVDALRVIAVAGVVLGHWLVTALVLTPDGALAQDSPLRAMPDLAPLSWLLQTLGLFFFVAGFAAARSWAAVRATGGTYGGWLAGRLRRLGRPLAAVAAVWAVALLVGLIAGAPELTLHTVVVLVGSPLWFLAVLVGLSAATAPARWAVRRLGPLAAVPAAGAVAVADAGWGVRVLTLLAAWAVPYLLGVAAAEGRLRRRAGWALAAGGATAVVALVVLAGYPSSAVGVPGAGGSNLDPPTLATVALAVAQAGLALLLRPGFGRLLARPAWWRPVAAVNRAALPVFLAHQSALIVVTVAGQWLGWGQALPGLHTPPVDGGWLAARLCWLAAFAVVLAVLVRGVPSTASSPVCKAAADRAVREPGRGDAFMA